MTAENGYFVFVWRDATAAVAFVFLSREDEDKPGLLWRSRYEVESSLSLWLRTHESMPVPEQPIKMALTLAQAKAARKIMTGKIKHCAYAMNAIKTNGCYKILSSRPLSTFSGGRKDQRWLRIEKNNRVHHLPSVAAAARYLNVSPSWIVRMAKDPNRQDVRYA